MYAPPPDPHWSIAIIRDNDDKSSGPFGVGSKIRDATIDRHRRDARLPRLRRRPARVPRPARHAGAAARRAGGGRARGGDRRIRSPRRSTRGSRRPASNNYEVQRATLDSLLGNMAVLSRAARIVPEMKDGKSAGFRLFSIRPDGPFAKIGLQNGDVISAINGLEMTSPDKALEVYTKLKTANHLSVGLERNGQKVTKDYNIR